MNSASSVTSEFACLHWCQTSNPQMNAPFSTFQYSQYTGMCNCKVSTLAISSSEVNLSVGSIVNMVGTCSMYKGLLHYGACQNVQFSASGNCIGEFLHLSTQQLFTNAVNLIIGIDNTPCKSVTTIFPHSSSFPQQNAGKLVKLFHYFLKMYHYFSLACQPVLLVC